MSKNKEIPSCCMNCDMFRVFDGQCAITETYIDDYLDKRAPNCPLEIVTCKDCKHRKKVKDDWGYYCEYTNMVMDDDEFCSSGERKE